VSWSVRERAARPGPGLRGLRAQGGVVALEVALVAPLVALLVVAVLAVLGPVGDVLAVEEAARAGARAVALTGDPAAGTAAAHAVLPGAQVVVDLDAEVVLVEVTHVRDLLGRSVATSGRAVAALEPAAAG